MKKILFTLTFLSLALLGSAQSNLYQDLKTLIKETHPEIVTDNKLLALNVWEIDNMESREANKSFEKAYEVYRDAKLKGGSKGIVVVSFNKNDLSSPAVISYSHDGIARVIPFKLSDMSGLDKNISNLVYDSSGNEVYRNLSAPLIYNSINHLITR